MLYYQVHVELYQFEDTNMRYGNLVITLLFLLVSPSIAFADNGAPNNNPNNNSYGPYGNGAQDFVGGLIAGEAVGAAAAAASNNSNGSSGGGNNYYYNPTTDNTAAAARRATPAEAATADRYAHPVDRDAHQAARRAEPNRGVNRGEFHRR